MLACKTSRFSVKVKNKMNKTYEERVTPLSAIQHAVVGVVIAVVLLFLLLALLLLLVLLVLLVLLMLLMLLLSCWWSWLWLLWGEVVLWCVVE